MPRSSAVRAKLDVAWEGGKAPRQWSNTSEKTRKQEVGWVAFCLEVLLFLILIDYYYGRSACMVPLWRSEGNFVESAFYFHFMWVP